MHSLRSTAYRRALRVTSRPFTLIEMMVVLLIIGMVLGLVGPAIMANFQKAKVKNTSNQLKLLRGCIDNYYLDMQSYPKSLNDLVQNPGSDKHWKGPYIQDGVVPKDAWDHDFNYSIPGTDGHDYDLYSYGQDDAPGGEGLNADIYPWDK